MAGLSESGIPVITRARIYALISAIETDLRRHIRHWLIPVLDAVSLYGERVDQIAERARHDNADTSDPDVLLEYIDWGDGFTLLNRHSQLVPDDISTTVRAFTPRFENTVAIRNRVMHSRPLLPDDDTTVVRLATDLSAESAPWKTLKSTLHRLRDDPLWNPDTSADTRTDTSFVHHNLPLPEFDETGLLGRKAENDQVVSYLLSRRYPVVTLVGEGGNGKTALAVKALYDVVDSPDCPYTDIVWISLKTERLTAKGIESIAATTADFAGLSGALSTGIKMQDEPMESVAEVLKGIPVLVAIDNVESANSDDIISLIESLPAETTFLLTSRVGLGQLERRVPVGPLKPGPAGLMFRKLAERRGLGHLATMSTDACDDLTARLSHRPLAIRWFVEAVDAGAQPEDVLENQGLLVQFCLEAIYDHLTEDAKEIGRALLAAAEPMPVTELVILTGKTRDETVSGLHELQRRSLVAVQTGSESVSQLYELSGMARHYLAATGGGEAANEMAGRLDALRKTEEGRRRAVDRSPFRPGTIWAESPDERAVVGLLHEALRLSKQKRKAEADAVIGRARDAAPDFYEVYRVAAFIESFDGPEEARRLYERAYEVAISDAQRARVAWWLAGLLMFRLNQPEEGAAFAQEAHSQLGHAETAIRLATAQAWLGAWDEAESLYRETLSAAGGGDARTRMIAHTGLLDLAKRRVEHFWQDQRDPLGAIRVGEAALREGVAVAAGGVADRQLHASVEGLFREVVSAVAAVPLPSQADDEVLNMLENVEAWLPAADAYGVTEAVAQSLRRLAASESLGSHVRQSATYLERSMSRQADGPRQRGYVRNMRGAFGFIMTPAFPDGLFFRADDADGGRSEAALFVRDCPVSFVLGENDQGPCAKAVRAEIAGEAREAALKQRRGSVAMVDVSFGFVRDDETEMTVFAHRTALKDATQWEKLAAGMRVTFDLEPTPRGPAARAGSLTVVQDVAE